MMDKKIILKDLLRINYLQGYYAGKWDDEYNREDTVEEYLEDMKELCDDYCIVYDKDINSYKCEEDEELYVTLDNMAFELKLMVERYLIQMLI